MAGEGKPSFKQQAQDLVNDLAVQHSLAEEPIPVEEAHIYVMLAIMGVLELIEVRLGEVAEAIQGQSC